MGFGDEGKGSVVDYLCSKMYNSLVIRYCGGHQVGHTVVKNNIRHVFSNFGSGTLSGTPTYWSKFCTVDPVGLVRELDILLGKGMQPHIFIDNRCPIVTPYDIHYNKIREKKYKHGTCGVGFGATIEREEKFYSLVAGDIKYDSVLGLKINAIKEYYGFSADLNMFIKSIERLRESLHVTFLNEYPYSSNIIFEGSQGLLLDQNIGFFPHVTRSNTGTKNILTFCDDFELFLVTRAYQTRHGNGPMTNKDIPHNIAINPQETNVKNKSQGEFRRSLLDVDLLLYGINKDDYIRRNENKTIVITCLDHIRDEYRFTFQGQVIYCDNELDFVSKVASILGIKNILISKSPYSEHIEKV